MEDNDDKATEKRGVRRPRIIVTSDLPTLVALEPWERAVVVPLALELLAPLVQGQEDDGAAQEDEDHDGRPVRAGVDR